MAQNDRVPMLHPTKKKDGKPVISYLNPNTVKSGKAEKSMSKLILDKPPRNSFYDYEFSVDISEDSGCVVFETEFEVPCEHTNTFASRCFSLNKAQTVELIEYLANSLDKLKP